MNTHGDLLTLVASVQMKSPGIGPVFRQARRADGNWYGSKGVPFLSYDLLPAESYLYVVELTRQERK